MITVLKTQDGGAPFKGAVHLIDWYPDLDGPYQIIVGTVTIHEAEKLLGFRTGASEANWFATIQGETDTVIIPGCKIAALSVRSIEGLTSNSRVKVVE